MGVLHAIHCTSAGCDYELEGAMISGGAFPKCPTCGGKTTWTPRGFNTDLYKTPKWNEASGQYHASTRDAERHMAELGFTPAGDAVGGARPTLSIEGTGFSYAGQSSRQSSGERERVRRGASHSSPAVGKVPSPATPAPRSPDDYLRGPQRTLHSNR